MHLNERQHGGLQEEGVVDDGRHELRSSTHSKVCTLLGIAGELAQRCALQAQPGAADGRGQGMHGCGDAVHQQRCTRCGSGASVLLLATEGEACVEG